MAVQRFDNLIGGQWAPADAYSRNINPSDVEDNIGEFASSSNTDMDAAVEAARSAFPAWANASPQLRHDVLRRVGEIIMRDKEMLGTLLSREEGKTLAEGIGETVRASQIFTFFAGEALRLGGEIGPSVRPGVDVMVERQAVGVVGLITPWNFPIAIPAWKAAPALAFGNCVVLKPAELTPACSWHLARIIKEAGCPDGVFNLVMGSGKTVGQALVENDRVDGVSFTGSAGVGRQIATNCAASGKRFQLEMGGKNPMVILDDADLELAVDVSINGAFFSTGQRCTASSRLIVCEQIHDEFLERLVSRASALRVGNALDQDTQVGPVVSEEQLNQNLGYLDIARDEGCEVIGGERLDGSGHFQRPAVLARATNDMRSSREEIFGPIASVIRVGGYDEALSVANDTDFGLSAGICTRSLAHATHFRKHARAGMVMVNLPTAGVDYHVPFGGTKASSHGPREQGTYARDFYTTIKTSYITA